MSHYKYRIATPAEITWAGELWDALLLHDRAALFFMTTGDFTAGMRRAHGRWELLDFAQQREVATTVMRLDWHLKNHPRPET